MTLFERCVEAVERIPLTAYQEREEVAITRAVLQTLLEGTESLRTAEEVSRVLSEVG